MHPIFIVLTALAQGYGVSWVTAWGEEIAAGGATNKVWTFLIQYILLLVTFSPLYFIYPAAYFTLNIAYYSSIAFAGALNYLASICHRNQLYTNLEEQSKLQWLPFNLHKNKLFSRAVVFSAKHLTSVLYALYTAVLVLSVISGHYLFVAATVSMIAIDRLYQYRCFPSFLETPYFLVRGALKISVIFGFSNQFWTALNIMSVAYYIWDQVQGYFWGVKSLSSQFSMTKKKHAFSFEDNAIKKPNNKIELLTFLKQFEDKSTRVTFNHFREANIVADRLYGKASNLDFNEYCKLFNQLDFSSPSLRSLIFNQMVEHDNFHMTSYEQHRKTLNLSPETEEVDVQIAYLKREMEVTIKKLQNPVYKALNNQNIYILLNQARLVLEVLKKSNDTEITQSILLSMAVRTGSQCYRMYLETFAELFHIHVYKAMPLTIKDKVILTAQSVREDTFRSYYYHTLPKLRAFQKKSLDISYLLSSDKHDYHTYEDFVNDFGGYFYLPNQALFKRTRGPIDVALDNLNTYALLKLIGEKCLFSDHYNEQCFIDALLDGKGKLHLLFQEWCNEFYPTAYQELTLDEDLYPLPDIKNNPTLRALAKLMLLDMGIVELTKPYQVKKEKEVKPISTYNRLSSQLGHGSSEPADKTQIEKTYGKVLNSSNGLINPEFPHIPDPNLDASIQTPLHTSGVRPCLLPFYH